MSPMEIVCRSVFTGTTPPGVIGWYHQMPTALPGPPAPSPQATPASSAAAFDAAESTWQASTKTECDAEQAKWSDGNIVNFMGSECAIRQSRARLRELAEVYRNNLHLD